MIRVIKTTRKKFLSDIMRDKDILHKKIAAKVHNLRQKLRKGAKKIVASAAVFGVAIVLTGNAYAAPVVELPKDVFEWVQSTSMSAYYFNKEQICYGKGTDGYIDRNILIVPSVKIYSDKQIEDVVQKKRWRMEKTDGYGDLVGAADYLQFNITDNTVTIVEHDDLDKNWWPLCKNTDSRTVKLSDLSEKAVDGIFYRAILSWAKDHDKEILAHTVLKGLTLKK